MLIEFNVTNYRSISETQTLSMTPNKSGELDNNYFESGVRGIPNLLSSVAMYGPNASGKSNFIKAMSFMKDFVLTSSKDRQEGDPITIEPFKFDQETRNSPSEFEVIFIQNGVRYQYGFSVTSDRIAGEWLFAFPEGRSQKWFERLYNFQDESEEWYLGSKLHGSRNIWKNMTRSNALYLSTAIQLNSEQLKPIFEWFQKLRIITQDKFISSNLTINHCMTIDSKQKIIDLMNAADFSIIDIHLEDDNETINKWEEFFRSEKIKNKNLLKVVKQATPPKVKLLHPSTCGSEHIPIDLEEESAGTQKFFSFIAPWLELLGNGHTYFIDELDNSMHPLMVRFLVGLLHDPLKNKNRAQLIFTTHDTSILDKEFLRRDQIWFFEKNRDNSTHLYPLTDFRPRKSEAFEKGYLQGRYGALPFFGGFDF